MRANARPIKIIAQIRAFCNYFDFFGRKINQNKASTSNGAAATNTSQIFSARQLKKRASAHVQKAEPDIPFDFENAQKGKDRRGDHPYEGTGAQRPNETALPFLPLIPAGRFAVRVGGDEIVERHPVQFGKRFEHAKVGKPFAPLPFGDGFIRIIEFFGDLELGHARRLAAPHEILRERGFPIVHVFIIT